MQLIETKTLGTAGSSISFADIPQTFTDLLVVSSLRGDQNANNGFTNIGFNSSTSNFSTRFLQGDGSGAASSTGTRGIAYLSNAFYTSNTFDSTNVYISNYTGSTNKSFSAESVVENNATLGWQFMVAGLWSNTVAITSIQITPNTGNFIAGSTISLYGIGGAGDGYAAKATGGSISFINGYWTHVFTSSGTFTPTVNLTNVEYLVIAGGGGAASNGGGGGAGGYRSSIAGESSGGGASAEAKLSLTAATNYTVTIGAGGSGDTGVASSFSTISSAGGGRSTSFSAGGAGGSGGGGGNGGTYGGGAGTANQGYNGGSTPGNGRSAGGGGAGAVGGNAGQSSGQVGAGGAGLSSSVTGSAVTRATGGTGMDPDYNNPGANGAANTGNGASPSIPSFGTTKTGGSGIVIVRYA